MEKIILRNQFVTLSIAASDYTVREETLDGKKHLVVPVVMMVEGVHIGSKGPILHMGAELSKWTEAWNGIPVTIAHPIKEGTNVSANAPDVLDSSSVGRIFNTTYDNGLKAEAWIDFDKINAKSIEALEAIQNGEPLDVSVGVFNDTEEAEEGAQWNGESYDTIAYNYRPDHLALLPGEEGACSWKDGCGIRTNKKGGDEVKELLTTFQELSEKGYVVSLLNNEMGFREIQEALQVKLQSLNADGKYHYIEEVFDDAIVYSKWADGGGETLYKQGYTMDDSGNIAFDGVRTEVKKKVEYVTNKMRRTTQGIINLNKGGKMANEGNLCCEAKVDALIANKRTHWQATDREWLLTQNEATIAKMSPMEPEVVGDTPAAIQANKAAAVEEFKGKLVTIDDYTAIMPEAMKARIDKWTAAEAAEREALVKSITDNSDKLKKEDLEVMSDEVLKGIAESIKQPADYSGMGAGGGESTSGEQVELPVEYSTARKEDK